jgi:hypothetical protein
MSDQLSSDHVMLPVKGRFGVSKIRNGTLVMWNEARDGDPMRLWTGTVRPTGKGCSGCAFRGNGKDERDNCADYPCAETGTIVVRREAPPVAEPEQPQGRSMSAIDVNTAALVRKDTRTVLVTYAKNPEVTHRFVTTFPDLVVGETVVTRTSSGTALAQVNQVDDTVVIDDTNKKLPWIISRVDTAYIEALDNENTVIEQAVAEQYQKRMQTSFREQILGGMSAEMLARLPASVTGAASALAAPVPPLSTGKSGL